MRRNRTPRRRARPPSSPRRGGRAAGGVLALVWLGAVLLAAHVAPAARADTRNEQARLPARLTSERDDALAGVRAQFVAALNALRAGAAAVEISDALRRYALYPYLEAARIERELADPAASSAAAADGDARAFLAAHGAEPVGSDVQQAWLASLARRQAWPAFLEHYDARTADQTLRCRAFEARIALDDVQGIAPPIVATWLSDHRLPPECEPVFQWLRAEGPLTDDLIEQRVVMLLENGQAAFTRIVAARLPPQRAAPLLRWASFIEQPRRAIDAWLAAPDPAVRLAAIAAAWDRLTRNEPAAALERYAPLIAALRLDAAAASRFAYPLALGLAWDRRPEALDYFRRIAAADLDDYALGWRARAALWNGAWRLAATSIDAMSSEQRDETRWRYWRARAAEQLHERRQARDLYRSILTRDNYYAALAAARLGEAAVPHPERLAADETELERLAARPAFVRARELYYAGMPEHASAEWRYGAADLGEDERKQSVRLAARWGWYDMAIATATQQRVFNAYRLLYPQPYAAAVDAAAELTRIDPPLIYGLIRQESLYRAAAASSAGALGLTQLMPDTARRVAANWGEPTPTPADLLIPAVNVKLGAAKLRELIDELGEPTAVALAGYNAGANAVRRWLPDQPLDADVWIENIPYNETRNFVQRVLWHSLTFAWLETGQPQTAAGWLATVSPEAGASDERNAARACVRDDGGGQMSATRTAGCAIDVTASSPPSASAR